MALQTSTLQDLMDLTFALIGREYANTSASYARINALWNQGAKMAYKKTDWWERYLVAGEPRTVTSNRINNAENAFFVNGAGLDAANGLYVKVGTYDSADAYSLVGETAAETYSLRNSSANNWEIVNGVYDDAGATVLYTHGASSGTKPDETDWSTAAGGTAPAPLVTDLSDIEVALRVHKTQPFIDKGAAEYSFYLKNSTIYVQGTVKNEAFVTYKKRLDVELATDDAVGTEIPAEFMPYMAHYAAYTWQRSVEQNSDEANFGLSLAIVNQVLEDELVKIDKQNLFNTTVARRYRTNYNSTII